MARLRLHRGSSKYLLKTLGCSKRSFLELAEGHLGGQAFTGCRPVRIASRQCFQCLFSTPFIPST